jgi:hypothetical protein
MSPSCGLRPQGGRGSKRIDSQAGAGRAGTISVLAKSVPWKAVDRLSCVPFWLDMTAAGVFAIIDQLMDAIGKATQRSLTSWCTNMET